MTRPIVTEYAGKVRFANVIDNVTVKSQVDEVTGLSSLVLSTLSTLLPARSASR